MAVKKSELYSSLWASCDALRGGMDASQYKDYILTLLFVKYVSDKYAGQDYPDIEIPEGGSFSDMVQLIGKKDIGEGINKVIARLAEVNGLRGVIDKVSFNDPDKLGKGEEMVKKLSKLIEIFRRPELDFSRNRAEGDDLIGDAYEYLMRKFATESGKSKGQFYTPAEVSRILAQVIGISQETRPEATIRSGNTFSDPQFFEEGSDETVLRRFDYVVANPPFSIKNWTDGLKEYGRFDGYGERPPEKNGDYAWLLHILKSLKRTGKAAVILPHGVLFRGNAEREIRKALIQTGYIKGIIGLPANLFYGTGIPACILVIDKEDAAERSGIFMIDASRDFVKDGNKNRLRERDIYKIVTTFNQQITTDPHYARFVSMEEITEKNDDNLNISRYIDPGIRQDLQSIEAHLRGGIPAYDVDRMGSYWAIFAQLKDKLFSRLRDGFYHLNVPKEDIRDTIHCDDQFCAYADKLDAAFMAWRDAVDGEMRSLHPGVEAKKWIVHLAQCILTQFEDIALIDKYDVYQVLLAYWLEVMSDDVYVVIHDGYEAGRELSYEYVVKTHKDGDETILEVTNKVKSWDGKLIPKTILTDAYFDQEAKAIAAAEVIAADTQAQIDELLENAEDGSILAELMDSRGKIPVKVLKAAIENIRSKIQSEELTALTQLLRAMPMKKKELDAYLTAHPLCLSARNEKGSVSAASIKLRMSFLRETLPVPELYAQDYAQLMELLTLMVRCDDQNKLVKALKAALDALLKEKYAQLTLEEIQELLVNRKWYYALYNGIDALYVDISHHMTDRVVQLAERYEAPLPTLSTLVADYEARVQAHLERMGFTW